MAFAGQAGTVAELKEKFKEFDIDGNGELDLKEMTVVLILCDPTLTAAHCKKLFDAIDTDGSGALSLDEFVDYFFTETTTSNNIAATPNPAMSSPTVVPSPSPTPTPVTPPKPARKPIPTPAPMPTPSPTPHALPEVSPSRVIVEGVGAPGMVEREMGNAGGKGKGLLNVDLGQAWKTLNSTGTTKMSKGSNSEALQDFEAALALNEEMVRPDKEGLGIIWNNIGSAKRALHDDDGASAAHLQVHGILMELGIENTLEALEAARGIHEELGTLEGAQGASLLLSLATLRWNSMDATGALEDAEDAMKILEPLGMQDAAIYRSAQQLVDIAHLIGGVLQLGTAF